MIFYELDTPIMMRTLTINNYRGFKHFEMKDLGRVNLLVGENNSGKTSVLEAIETLTSPGNVKAMTAANFRRGEFVFPESDRKIYREADICHLFHGHTIEQNSYIELKATNDHLSSQFKATIVGLSEVVGEGLFDDDPLSYDAEESFAISLEWGDHEENKIIPIRSSGSIPSGRFGSTQILDPPTTRFISARALDTTEMHRLFQEIILTPDEDYIVEVLQLIEPTILRIAPTDPVGLSSPRNSREILAFKVKLKNTVPPVPIGSLGDGIWRLLGITLALVRSKGGVLLIDEIDTGLHYSVMEKMWMMVNETAKRLNVQVFATTHSRDCYESLAAVAQENSAGSNELSIQRIECNKEQAVAYSEQEILMAAKHGIEVR